jgi:hypothetical protein
MLTLILKEGSLPEEKKSLQTKLAEVMAAVKRIPKRGRNNFHGYDYVTEADLADAIRDELSQRNVVLVPDVEAVEMKDMPATAKGKAQFLTTVNMRWTFMDGDSDSTVSFRIPGFGIDGEDKGGYKAITGAEKYALMKFFLVPTGDDPEADEKPKPQDRNPAPQQQPQQQQQRPSSPAPRQQQATKPATPPAAAKKPEPTAAKPEPAPAEQPKKEEAKAETPQHKLRDLLASIYKDPKANVNGKSLKDFVFRGTKAEETYKNTSNTNLGALSDTEAEGAYNSLKDAWEKGTLSDLLGTESK